MSTSFLEALEPRVVELCDRYLPLSQETLGDYSDEQLDDARACILLVHSEIENYLEDMSLALASRAAEHMQTESYDALTTAFAFHAGTKKVELNATNAAGATRGYEQLHGRAVRSNNGVRSHHLKTLFSPFSVGDDLLNDDLVAALDTFGNTRGGIAHRRLNSGINRTINPYETRLEIREILGYLRAFDASVLELAPDIENRSDEVAV